MKGCLKQPSPVPSPGPECLHARKCVAFEADGSEQIFFADEWDRTPTEPTRKLSYQDLMELKEIQRSLPLANQPPDPVLGRPGRHYLSAVPIALLPLLPRTDTAATATTTRSTPHRHITSRSPSPHQQQQQPVPSTNSNLKISNPLAQRPRANFTFLPLLDTPGSSDTTPLPSNPSSRSTSPDLPSDTDQSLDPPTPALSYASLDSSPMSRASSSSPEPTFLQLPPRHLACGDERYCNKHFGPRDSYFPDMDEASDHTLDRHHCAESNSPKQPIHVHNSAQEIKPSEPPKRARKRNVIVVNDVEIELDDEEDDEDEPTPEPAPAVPSCLEIANNMSSQLHQLSLNGAEHQESAKNLKPPETETSTETKLTSFDNCIPAIGGGDTGGFGLHAPLRFKRRNSSTDTSNNFTYTGRS